MTAYHSNGERSKSPSGQQERVTEGDKDESPRVTRTNHRGWQGRITEGDKDESPGRTKTGLREKQKILGKGKKTSSWQSFRKRLLYLHAQAKAFTRTSWGLYPDKLRPLPGQVEAFTCSAKGLYTEWGWPKCETRSLAPKVVKIRKQAAPSPHTTIRQKAQVVRL